MLQKISYDVVFSPSKHSNLGDGMLMIKASQGERVVTLPTNIYCNKDHFTDGYVNEKNPQYQGLNAMLNQILLDVQQTEIDAFRRGIQASAQSVFTMYLDKVSACTPLVDFCEYIMNNTSNRREVTKRHYRDVVKIINDFHPKVCLEDIDSRWLKKFEKNQLIGGVTETTIWSRMKILRTLFNEAIKREMFPSGKNPFKFFTIPELHSRNDVLMFSEIEELELMGFKNAQDRHIRDLFCFAAYVGLRWSDLRKLTNDNLRVTGGVTWLEVKTQKTGAFVQIPISIVFFGNAMRILEKYGGYLEKLCNYDNNAAVNRGVKLLMDKTDIGGGQHITMHTARRSFITNLTDFGVPISSIQKLAGHQKITTTQRYCILSTGTIQRDLEKAFGKESSKIVHVDLKREVIRISATGKKLVVGSEIMRCGNCSFYGRYKCNLFKKKRNVDDWCDSFSERLEGEPCVKRGKWKKKGIA